MISDMFGWWRWNNLWNRGNRGLGEDGFCCGLLKYFCNFYVRIGYIRYILQCWNECVSLDCSSASMSLDVYLRYVSGDTFGKGIFVVNQSIVVVALVKLVDVTKHF